MENKSVLKTENLILKPWEIEDKEELYNLAKDPDVGPHAGWKPHESIEESEEIIKTIFNEAISWKIILRETGEIVGCVGLENDKYRPEIKSKELGYWVGKKFWKRGIVTEASKAVISYAMSKEGLDLEIIAIVTGPENKRSQRVIEKLGFTYEGTLRKAYKIYDGSLRDVLCYSLIRE